MIQLEIWIVVWEGCTILPPRLHRGLEPARPLTEEIPEWLPIPRSQWGKIVAVTTPKEITQYIYAMSAKGAVR